MAGLDQLLEDPPHRLSRHAPPLGDRAGRARAEAKKAGGGKWAWFHAIPALDKIRLRLDELAEECQ
jgi:hypothetical protein